MSRSFANTLSYILHPLAMPTLGVLFLLEFLPYHTAPRLFFVSVGVVFTGTYLLPVLLSVVLLKLNAIGDLHMSDAQERRVPLLLSLFFYYLTALGVRKLPLPDEVYLFLLAGVLVLLLILLGLRWLKISMHTAGLGALLGLVISISFYYGVYLVPLICLIVLFAGLTGTARLILEAHEPGEVYLGFFLGFSGVITFLLLA